MNETIPKSQDYAALIADLKSRVRAAQIKAAISVNRELIALYWDLGGLISERIERARWGENIIAQIATDLRREFPAMKGFSRANLYNMRQWHRFFASQDDNVQQLVGQIP